MNFPDFPSHIFPSEWLCPEVMVVTDLSSNFN